MSVARMIGRAIAQGSRFTTGLFSPRLISTTPVQRLAEAASRSSSDSAAGADGKASINSSVGKQNESEKQDVDVTAKLKQLEELSAKNKELTAAAADFKDKYVRALAETENVRTRLRKEIDNAKDFSISSFSKDILDVADLLSLALRNVDKRYQKDAAAESDSSSSSGAAEASNSDGTNTVESQLRVIVQGVEMTQSALLKVLNKHGLNSYSVEPGAQFDPARHQALYQIPTEDAKQHATVAECVKLGYTLRERVLRPAFVGVYKK